MAALNFNRFLPVLFMGAGLFLLSPCLVLGASTSNKPTLTKAFNPGTIVTGQTATLTFTITSQAGGQSHTGLTFTDTFPANLVIAGTPNVVNNCGGTPTITAVPGSGTFDVGGSGVNASAGPSACTVSVDVTSTTAGSYVNGAGQVSTAPSGVFVNGVTDQTLYVNLPPNLTVLKYAFGVTSGASAKPGQEIPYMVTVSNTGAGVAGNVVVQDCLSPYSAWTLNSFAFTDGAAPSSGPSGLSLSGSTMYYSYDNAVTWTTTAPADDGTGHAPAVNCWKLVMDPTKSMNPNPASFALNYQAQVK